ncbi:MAG: guanine permease [Treponema sp.]|nr:MAG: guanine permease [Treponema sp.]
MEKFFKLEEKGATVRKELIAGATTFLAMAYILAVNPDILSKAGLSIGGVFTATAIAAGVASIFMGLMANLPIALAPGMGLNAFFTFTVVMGMKYSPAVALTAVFLEGLLFMVLSFFNVRETIIKSIPDNLKKATAAGIGIFITLIGMKGAGIIVPNPATMVALGDVSQGHALLALIGLIITASLFALKIPGAILLGIIATTIIGIPMGLTVPMDGWAGWSPISLPEAPIFMNLDFSHIFSLKFFTVFFSFLFVDIFDTVGTLVGVTTQAGLTDKNGEIPKVKQAFLADALGTTIGALLGTSTVTSYIESSAGVAAGGRTGLTSVTTGILFFVALIFSPFFLLVPVSATAPALIIVGSLMIAAVAGINFKDPTEGLPAFITIVMIPFTYSIAEGIVYGVLTYVLVKALTGKFKDISVVTWILFVVFVLRFFIK